MADELVALRLPPGQAGPGYRTSLLNLSRFRVDDVGDGVVLAAPQEGAGSVREYLRLDLLCDANTDMDSATAFEPIRNRPPVSSGRASATMLENFSRLTNSQHNAPAIQLTALMTGAVIAAQRGELEDFVRLQATKTLKTLPGSSWWYLSVDPVLFARSAFFRSQLALALTPDLAQTGAAFEQVDALRHLTFSHGVNFGALVDPALLAFSPVFTGLPMTVFPNCIVFMTGGLSDLTSGPLPSSPAELFVPGVLGDHAPRRASKFHEGLTPSESTALLRWWVDRLNVILSHAFDPTRWVTQSSDPLGTPFLDPAAQTAWMVSVERLIGDGTFLLGQPSASGLARVQAAFDLLDKAEALLGYDKKRSGRGFEALLRRRSALERINATWSTLPGELPDRFASRTTVLFDTFYERMLDNATPSRRDNSGVQVANRRDPTKLVHCAADDYVASVCRTVRNSSHGLLDILARGHDRYLLATHTGGMPMEMTELAAMVMLALVADAEALCDGTWSGGLKA